MRQGFATVLLTTLLLLLGGNLYLSVDNLTKEDKHFNVVCAEHKTLARIAKEEIEELRQSNKLVLTKLTIAGISHDELIQLTLDKEAKKVKHAAELEQVRRETC